MVIIEAHGDLDEQNFDVETDAEILFLHVVTKQFQALDLISAIGATFATHRDDVVQFLQDRLVGDLLVLAEWHELLNLNRRE